MAENFFVLSVIVVLSKSPAFDISRFLISTATAKNHANGILVKNVGTGSTTWS